MVKVLFVCLGNICRSPMAEAVFSKKVQQAGLQNFIEVDSAGTGDWHVGQMPHRGTLEVLQRHHIPHCSRARLLQAEDFDIFDYIVAMDESNLRNIAALTTTPWPHSAEVSLLLDFVPGRFGREVPDPYFSGGFDGVYEMVDAACDALLLHIRQRHSL